MLSSIFGFGSGARSTQPQSVVDGNTAFALDLYGHLKSTHGNLFFSPYSISSALALTYAGARGDTEKQMAQVCHFEQDQRRLHASFCELQRQLKEAGELEGIEVNIANALWAQKGHPFLPAFLDVAQGKYGSSVNQADFSTGADAARNEINRWVTQQTKDRIQNILPPGSLHALTRLVLANAIYFKGAWTEPFEKTETSTQPFHLSAVRETKAPLMHHFDNVRYMKTFELQAVELPYGTGELAMVILLPTEVDGCGKLESRLTPALLSSAISQMKRQQVEIFLPRFKLESSFDLNDTLTRMGMPDAFGSRADFSGMDGTRLLFLSGIFHKAWGEVNEEGTEAAAATVVAVAGCADMKPPPPPPVFRADHPFIFFIRDTRSGSLLFLGRLADPA
jgi:serpin B